jgi:predicted AlkP superfamily phosphohydrolase/phosphomutase
MRDAAQKMSSRKVLMIGLDAAEISLVERWMDDGSMPRLRSLRDRGASSRLASTAGWLVGSPWPSFYTGLTPAEHGLYHYLLWRPEKMAAERPSPDWLPLRPFWRDIAHERQVVAIDVPLTYAPGDFGGIEVCGWATHETLQAPCTMPPELMSRIVKEFGRPPLGNEEARLLAPDEILAVRDQCIRSARMVADLALELMRRDAWDLFLVCLAAAHRGGHQLWDLANLSGEATPEQGLQLRDALRCVYMACDEAIGRLLDRAGQDVTVLVFALHGMGPNVSRADLLGQMLARVLEDGVEASDQRAGAGLLQRLRAWAPARLRSWVKGQLPYAMQDRLTQFWRTGGLDWSSTRAFAQLSDLDGYVRINLRGREANGIVEPGAEYVALRERLCEGLRTFVDADTGQPVVEAIARPEDLYPAGAMISHLPDLMLRWNATPAAAHREIVSPRHGRIAWPTPGRHPQGRSGNHRPEGFLIAAGGAVTGGLLVPDPHILDLAPTVYRLLELPVPQQMHGRPLFRGGSS